MSRYNFKNNKKLSNNDKRIYKTIIYPEIRISDIDIYISGKSTDRLDLLAYEYYNDSTLWWIIAHANKIKGSMYIPDDTQLRIPMNVTQILLDLKRINEY